MRGAPWVCKAFTRPAGIYRQDQSDSIQLLALLASETSKYWIAAFVKGLQNTAMQCCQAVSPTIARRSMSW